MVGRLAGVTLEMLRLPALLTLLASGAALALSYELDLLALGDEVAQKGSNITAERLRFDFTHFEAISPEELRQVEELVNDAVLEGYPVVTEVLPIEEAKKKGAVAMFGEKYGDIVRVVEMGDFSMEYDLKTPEQQAELANVVRFAIDRSRLTQEHLDYVIAAVKALYEDRESIPNMRIVWGHNLPMRHFHAFLEPYPNEEK